MKMRTETGLLLILTVAAALLAGCGGGVGDVDAPTGSLASDDQVEQVQTATVVGRLVSLRTGSPVDGVRVRVGGVASVTDRQGVFTADSVPLGQTWLTVDDGRYSILGGPVEIQVQAGLNDAGQIVCGAVATIPPAAPQL